MPATTTLVKNEDQGVFLDAFAKTGSINGASNLTGIARSTHYKWLQAEKDGGGTSYSEGLEDAKQRYRERLEDEIDRRAVEGIDEGVYYQGSLVGYQRRYSDNLLMFRAKKEMPEYRDSYTVRHEGEVQVNVIDEALRIARNVNVIDTTPLLIGEEQANEE